MTTCSTVDKRKYSCKILFLGMLAWEWRFQSNITNQERNASKHGNTVWACTRKQYTFKSNNRACARHFLSSNAPRNNNQHVQFFSLSQLNESVFRWVRGPSSWFIASMSGGCCRGLRTEVPLSGKESNSRRSASHNSFAGRHYKSLPGNKQSRRHVGQRGEYPNTGWTVYIASSRTLLLSALRAVGQV